ncbi:HpcH/HpaI aldolase family protein [Planctomicrobium piriforme]|uniref:2-dehydro-3-deoxyglucarate aldolase/4-hydroxy-2-oxoheptanedioate aldolase n=1 Tax=Planctomicrobium piriforme TaxID=1576369 RepID=A0A1I3RPG4_9PLAN|nr:aldolase/citrate lyase family protein [Planctomicrobium piriforme]SFJ48463.1 2-dehydro-3-deoxyglucarate aldolase/4-hydroxy-2-oxoheptanedioate aldolase [Planctomicrobium piriforme]
MSATELSGHNIGSWISSGSAVIAELAGGYGFDWLLIDLEHGNGTEADVPGQLRALRGSSSQPIVRVGAPHPDLIARVLDWGARGIMVPHVNSPEEAAACVQAMRYPPRGKRGVARSVRAFGYGLQPFTGSDPAADPIFIAQIETIEAVANAESIAAVDGVHVLFIGPADLQFDLQARPELATCDYETCLKQVAAAAKKAGKQAGILLKDPGELPRYLGLGYNWPAVDSDLGLLRTGYQHVLQTWKTSIAKT